MSLLFFAFLTSALYYRHILDATTALAARYRTDGASQSSTRRRLPDADRRKTELAQQWQSGHAIVERLSIPWMALFDTLEAAAGDDVVLFRVEPDVGRHEVRLTVQTQKWAYAAAYARRLMNGGAFARVVIVSQREMTQDLGGAIQVILSGKWTAASSSSYSQNAISSPLDQTITVARGW